MSQKRKRSPGPQAFVFRSKPVEDRTSKFIGYFSPTLKPKELQSMGEFSSASHKMLAWRRESNQQAISGGVKYTTDSDDDGEKYGGKRIEKVLDSMRVVGSCVVARWYGGVLLGPVRFEHIERCAKEAIQNWKDSVAEEESKKRKLLADEAEAKRLVKVLAERDESIVVLRQLAAEKEEKLKQAKKASEDVESQSQTRLPSQTTAGQPKVDYASMPADRLKVLEKARDATLEFLLKRINKAEVELVGVTGELLES